MQKPITVIEYEFENNLIDLINGSGLPMFIVESVLKDIILSVKSKADEQLRKDLEDYRSYLLKVNENVHEQGQVRACAPKDPEAQCEPQEKAGS